MTNAVILPLFTRSKIESKRKRGLTTAATITTVATAAATAAAIINNHVSLVEKRGQDALCSPRLGPGPAPRND